MLIARHMLIATEAFGPALDANAAARAIARGLIAAGAPEPDLCPIELNAGEQGTLATLLAEIGFDRRMRAARALVVGAARLREQALAGSVAFELATRARQSGVPAYAVTAMDELNPFDARILDLQLIITATDTRALAAAGRKLAGLL